MKFGNTSQGVLRPKIWTSLPPLIKNAENLFAYKRMINAWNCISYKCNKWFAQAITWRQSISRYYKCVPYLDDTKINNLLFADDLAISSLSKEDFQEWISILQQYSNEWGLELNLSKVKVMVFNKQGATLRKFKFYFQRKQIKIVK